MDPRDRRIEQLESQLADALAAISQLQARVVELEARLKADSTTSSKPPSSDGLSKRPAQPRERGKRGPGGQPGDRGRYLMQVAEPDVVIEHEPHWCGSCGASLSGAELVQSETRQVADLPPIELVWTEHRSRRRRCGCGHVTAGVFPESVTAPAQYGPGMQAAAAYLCGYQHVPYARARQVFADLLGAAVSTGWIAGCVAGLSDAVVGAVEQIADAIAGAEVGHFDETGARVDGRLWWVHVASTDRLTHLDLHDRRGAEAMTDIGILPAFIGVAVHDGWHPYRTMDRATHALCNAHHLRELRGIAELYGQPWAESMIELLLEIKTQCDSARAAGRSALSRRAQARYRHRYDQLIRAGWAANPPPPRTGRRGRPKLGPVARCVHRLDRDREQALRFMTDLRIPFDNNQAERDIRMIKVQQKISGGWRTVEGAMRYLDLRSYIDTARKNDHSVIAALRAAAEGCPWLPPVAYAT